MAAKDWTELTNVQGDGVEKGQQESGMAVDTATTIKFGNPWKYYDNPSSIVVSYEKICTCKQLFHIKMLATVEWELCLLGLMDHLLPGA